MSVDPQLSVPHVAGLLLALTQPDTARIRQAEQALKPILKQPASMAVLWQIVRESPEVPVRHVGAIVLRKRLPAHYGGGTFDAAAQLQWQTQVLAQLAAEPVRPVRAGLVGVAAALAQIEQTPTAPFLQFLAAAASSPDESARELGFLLLQEMTETVGMHWKSHLADLQGLFGAALNSPTEGVLVQKAAVRAVGQLLSYWADEDEELRALAPLLPTVLQIAARHAQDEDFLATLLDVLYDLAYSPSPALAPHMAMTVEFCLQVLQDRRLELRVRDAAALVVATTAEAKPKTLGRATELLGRVLDVLFQLMQVSSDSAAGALFETNPAWKRDLEGELLHHDGGDDGDDDLDSPTETSMAQGTLDMIACELPKKHIWQPALTRCVDRMRSPDPAARKAGVAGLGVIAEGCAEPLAAALGDVMPLVFAAAQDTDAQVRECACFCLGQISEHCQPDILSFSEQILPIVFRLLDDKSVAVQVTSCYVLEMFCERLEPTAVRPLLDPLVRKLAAMLEATTKRSVQEMAVAALAATAVAAEEEFAPYVPGVANLMSALMQITDPELSSLRGRALECMGHMAIAVGRDHFRPYFTVTMQCAFANLQMDSTELQEFSYAVFANLAKVMQDEFAPALPELVPHLIKVLEEDEGQLVPGEGEEEFGGLDDSDDEDPEGQMVLQVRTALLDVKKGAITALGEMASYTGTSFCPYLEQCMQVLQTAATNWHPLIKSEAADAFPSLITPMIAAYHNGEVEYKKGDLTVPNALSQHTMALVEAVLNEEISLMNDDDKGVVGKACEGVQSVIEICGPHSVTPVADPLLKNLHALLNKQSPCYGEDAMYGEVPDDDDDHDPVTQAACDLVGGICRVMGQHFVRYLPEFLPAICEYGKSSRPPSDRSMSVGCLSEIAEELEGGILEFWPSVFRPAVLSGLVDSDDNVKRNAAFCTGMCAQHLRDNIAADYPLLLERLGPIFALDTNAGDSTAACIDNAAAALCRMIMACPNNVPIDQVLPVCLRVLPLKTDMTENNTVYTCLMGLIQAKHSAIQSNAPEVKRILTEACQDDSQVKDELKSMLRSALQSMSA